MARLTRKSRSEELDAERELERGVRARRSRARRSSRPDTKDDKAEKQPAADWPFVEAVLASPHARTSYLYGPPGVGKTWVAMHSGLNGRDMYAVTLTPETPSSELRGSWMPQGDGFVWQDGLFVRAMKTGARIVINEVAYASSDVLAILHPVLESKETAQLTLPNLETVVPAEGFQVVCTDNCPVDQLPEALQDRFRAVLRVDRPHPDALARLQPDLREAALRTFDLEPDRAISVRGWLAVQDFESELGRERACWAVFGRERGDQIHKALQLGAS